MSSVSCSTSLNSSCSWTRRNRPFVPAKKAVIKDKIVSSKFADTKQFVPSYMKTELKPEICSLLTMEYSRIWQEEHKAYDKNVIEGKLMKMKKKPLKRPTFQLKNWSATAGAGDVLSSSEKRNQQLATRSGPQVLNSKQSKPLKSIWR